MSDVLGKSSIRFKHILVLDDESDVGEALKDLLETSFVGVRVHARTTAKEALATLT